MVGAISTNFLIVLLQNKAWYNREASSDDSNQGYNSDSNQYGNINKTQMQLEVDELLYKKQSANEVA
jgi:hypothetical protein